MPCRGKSAEMIQTNYTHVIEQRAHPVDAPLVTGPSKSVPIVDWIAPELALTAEVVWGHAGFKALPAPLVQQKELRICPHITRIGRDKKRQIPDQSYSFSIRILFQASRLPEQQELCQANLIDLV